MTTEAVSFPCSQCGGKMETKDSRPATFLSKQSIRRRRVCKKCGYRVTTFEVIARDGEDFANIKLPGILAHARRASAALQELISRYDSETPTETVT